MFLIITTILISSLIMLFFIFGPSYLSHILMTKDEKRPIGKANFRQFKERFEKIKNWEYDSCHENSLFCQNKIKSSPYGGGYYKVAYLHANKFVFNENIMLLYPLSYFRAKLLIRKKIKQIKTNKIMSWDEIESREVMEKISDN